MKERTRLTRAVQTGLKAGLIGLLILLFLIPLGMIRQIRSEREGAMEGALADVSSKAGGPTRITTPFLAVPVGYETREVDEKGAAFVRKHRGVYIVFPQSLAVSGDVHVALRTRGIYAVPVHQGDFGMDVDFVFHPEETDIAGVRVEWDDIRLHFAYDDSRSLRESPVLLDRDGSRTVLRSNTPPIGLADRSVSAPVRLTRDPASGWGRYSARLELKLSGAESLYFLPLADSNEIKLTCDWASPSFNGYRLPAERVLGDAGFTAEWFLDEASRVLPRVQNAADFRPESVAEATFGADFLQPTDVYQQVHRALRYAVLFLFIPFAALFLFEILSKTRLHVVQYILVGLANCVFYLLLLALAEHLPFLTAYLISSAAVCAVTTFYVSAFLTDKRQAILAFSVLALQYGYLFCALSSEDYALLIGSVGLFGIVALTMAATRRIEWYDTKEADTVGEAWGEKDAGERDVEDGGDVRLT